jgi:hypothetical protein
LFINEFGEGVEKGIVFMYSDDIKDGVFQIGFGI